MLKVVPSEILRHAQPMQQFWAVQGYTPIVAVTLAQRPVFGFDSIYEVTKSRATCILKLRPLRRATNNAFKGDRLVSHLASHEVHIPEVAVLGATRQEPRNDNRFPFIRVPFYERFPGQGPGCNPLHCHCAEQIGSGFRLRRSTHSYRISLQACLLASNVPGGLETPRIASNGSFPMTVSFLIFAEQLKRASTHRLVHRAACIAQVHFHRRFRPFDLLLEHPLSNLCVCDPLDLRERMLTFRRLAQFCVHVT
mmetsp:Transcript_24665/g.48259  ORF Transcript_24665/g.48259 Transcript_24665/m.48259 type:complete len:252 (+) Transcript_24665:175-930(+)